MCEMERETTRKKNRVMVIITVLCDVEKFFLCLRAMAIQIESSRHKFGRTIERLCNETNGANGNFAVMAIFVHKCDE